MRRWYACATRNRALRPANWEVSNGIFLGTFLATLAIIYIFILLVDPYGVVPFSQSFVRPLTSSQRQMYPQILRTGRYDSIVVGTSTSKLLDPAALDRALGGHFATLAMPAATALEQVQIMDYFRRTIAAPKAVLVGLDHEWCYRNSNAYTREQDATREREFPAWAYDESRWNDFLYLLNIPTLDAAGRAVGSLMGIAPAKLREDGFEGFVPPESTYDLARARGDLWGPADLRSTVPVASPPESGEADYTAMEFPALPWLDERLASLPGETRKFLVFPPVHVNTLPTPSSPRETWETECKRRVTTIARRRGAVLVDWRIVSPLTTEDSYFWDPIHYRLPIAYRMIDDLAHIVSEGRESPDGSYRILVR